MIFLSARICLLFCECIHKNKGHTGSNKYIYNKKNRYGQGNGRVPTVNIYFFLKSPIIILFPATCIQHKHYIKRGGEQ